MLFLLHRVLQTVLLEQRSTLLPAAEIFIEGVMRPMQTSASSSCLCLLLWPLCVLSLPSSSVTAVASGAGVQG